MDSMLNDSFLGHPQISIKIPDQQILLHPLEQWLCSGSVDPVNRIIRKITIR